MEDLNAYEQERLERIRANQARLDELGIKQQATLLQSKLQMKAQRPRTPGKAKSCPVTPARSSARLAKAAPEFKGLADDFVDGVESSDGRTVLPKSVAASEQDQRWKVFVSERRCDSRSRGSIYCSVAGICCHFCRQKKLCGEADCERCAARDPSLPCRGKSECSRCGSATGRFCRACLAVRYGERLEDVRSAMAAGTWLCPHCYEADHPEEGWICNSSICMTKRGLKPTGIAIFEAQGKGFASVGHYVQAQLLQHRQARGGAAAAARAPAAPADAAVTITVSVGAAAPAAAARAGKAGQGPALAAKPEAGLSDGEPRVAGHLKSESAGGPEMSEPAASAEGPPTPSATPAELPGRSGSDASDAAAGDAAAAGAGDASVAADGQASGDEADAARATPPKRSKRLTAASAAAPGPRATRSSRRLQTRE